MSDRVNFSIITVCKNPGDSFQHTLTSLQRQVYRNFECIVIDGASTDGTLDKIKKSKEITKYLSEPDKGIYDAMNKGIGLATGDYVYFLNCGDSFYDENVLLRLSESITKDSGDLFYGDACLVDDAEKKTSIKHHGAIDKYYLFNKPINHQAIFAKRSLFYTVGVFDTSFVVKADHDWILKCLNSGVKFEYRKITIVNYTLHGFAFQNKGIYRATEKKRIQKRHFKATGRLLVRLTNRLDIRPSKFLRSVLNKFL